MSCSRDSTVKYLIDKNLVKPNMELYTSVPSARLSNTIDRLTRLAKNTYGVDMGPLFSIKFREINIGNYLIQGSQSVKTKVRVEPNNPAFEAIDRSKQQDINAINQQLDEYRYQQMGKLSSEYANIQKEGNFTISDDGDIIVPTSLPQINVRC